MQRTMRLAGCVELSIDEVMRAFEEPGIDEVMAAAMRAALEKGSVDIELHITGPEWIAHRSARATVRWRVDGREGQAAVQFLVLRSGQAPLTEVLLGRKTVAPEDPPPPEEKQGA